MRYSDTVVRVINRVLISFRIEDSAVIHMLEPQASQDFSQFWRPDFKITIGVVWLKDARISVTAGVPQLMNVIVIWNWSSVTNFEGRSVHGFMRDWSIRFPQINIAIAVDIWELRKANQSIDKNKTGSMDTILQPILKYNFGALAFQSRVEPWTLQRMELQYR